MISYYFSLNRVCFEMKSLLALFSVAFLLMFTVKKNEVVISFEINYKNHTDIFNYLSKMENFPVLNPTIYRIELLGGNEEEFTILYDECLSHFPRITNNGRAHYKLFRNDRIGPHELLSVHSTCFVGGCFCLPTVARVVISDAKASGTLYEEVIMYNCPWIMTDFCLREIFFQRTAIMNGLENVFGTKEPR